MTLYNASKDPNGERDAVLARLVETAMVVLGFVWMGLLILDLTQGLSPVLSTVFNVIWVIFIADFAVRLVLAADKIKYLRANWLTGVSLLIPAIRVLRIVRVIRLFRAASVARGLSLARLITSFNRSARALGATMHQRGFGYVLALTVIVALSGAAGMFAFEKGAPNQQGFDTYGDALWWTAMIITTLGSQYWPVTVAGRILCLILSIYAFTVFGYIAAVLASHFIGRDAAQKSDAASAQEIRALQTQIAALNEALRLQQTRAGSEHGDANQPSA